MLHLKWGELPEHKTPAVNNFGPFCHATNPDSAGANPTKGENNVIAAKD